MKHVQEVGWKRYEERSGRHERLFPVQRRDDFRPTGQSSARAGDLDLRVTQDIANPIRALPVRGDHENARIETLAGEQHLARQPALTSLGREQHPARRVFEVVPEKPDQHGLRVADKPWNEVQAFRERPNCRTTLLRHHFLTRLTPWRCAAGALTAAMSSDAQAGRLHRLVTRRHSPWLARGALEESPCSHLTPAGRFARVPRLPAALPKNERSLPLHRGSAVAPVSHHPAIDQRVGGGASS